MKFKALKSFVSSIGTFNVDEEYDVRLDKPTSKMWVEHGLIEEVKATDAVKPTKKVIQEQGPVKTVKKSKKSKKSVTADENK